MDEIVSYQLSHAARSSHALFSAPIDIANRAHSGNRAEPGKGLQAQGRDLQVISMQETGFMASWAICGSAFGNLLENAFKWAKCKVLLTVKAESSPTNRRPGVTMSVADDGPGIAPGNVELMLQRGVRGDERVQGHGIGLAIVQDIVHSYRGELIIGKSKELDGAEISIRIPQVF